VRRITLLALPIIGAMVSQNILNLVDTAMVSRLNESNAALAAVGFGGFILFFSQAILLGLSTGVQASASRQKGQGKSHTTAYCLNAALIVILISSPFLTLFLICLAPKFFPILSSNPLVAELGIPYLQIRAIGIIFVAANFAFRGYWNAVDMTWLYLKSLVSMHALNIFLNYALIFGHFGAPKLGVNGAAIASVIAIGFGTLTYFILGFRHARQHGFLGTFPRLKEVKQLIKISLPNGMQQMFFAAGFIVMFWIIGKMGVEEVAAANVLINMWLITLLPGMGMGLAAATLIGQALGKGDPEDAVEWGWDVSKVTLLGMLLIGLPFVVMPELILTSMYKLEPDTLALAIWPMRIIGISTLYEAIGVVLQGALLGAGDTRRVMSIVVLGQWIFFLPIAYLIGPVLGYGLTAIWVAQTIYRMMQTGIWISFWIEKKWAKIQL
jgi:multidrug resistance protein, MATE family